MENKKITPEEGAALKEMCLKLKALTGITVKLVGTWLWISGDTKSNKEALKDLGCVWASKKKVWTWHTELLPGEDGQVQRRSWRGRKTKDLYDLEQKYGCAIL